MEWGGAKVYFFFTKLQMFRISTFLTLLNIKTTLFSKDKYVKLFFCLLEIKCKLVTTKSIMADNHLVSECSFLVVTSAM